MQSLTTVEAAAQLNISDATIRAQIRKGKLTAEKRGRDYFIDESEVRRYRLENQPTRRGGRSRTRS